MRSEARQDAERALGHFRRIQYGVVRALSEELNLVFQSFELFVRHQYLHSGFFLAGACSDLDDALTVVSLKGVLD